MMKELCEIEPSVSYRHRGEIIKFKRKQMGYSQKLVAAKIKMSQSGLSKIEAGINEMPRKMVEIMSFLKIDNNTVLSIRESKSVKDNSDNDFIKEIESKLPNWKEILIKEIKNH